MTPTADPTAYALGAIDFFYAERPQLRCALLRHSQCVCDKALAIGRASGRKLDFYLVIAGALLHDLGIVCCHAPGIGCFGTEPYLRHGLIGGALLNLYAMRHPVPARDRLIAICERHTGSGLTASEIAAEKLPLPEQDFLPETPEEKLIMLADKFFSKSGDGAEKPLAKVRSSLARFGTPALARFDAACREFGLDVAAVGNGIGTGRFPVRKG